MEYERIFTSIRREIDRIWERLSDRTENVAFEHTGDGDPSHVASVGVFYWDYTNDNLWVNSSGTDTWQYIGGAGTA